MPEQTCPALPTGSVDFNAFHESAAASNGEGDLTEALAAATIQAELPPEPVSLSGKDKKALLLIAEDENVVVPAGATVSVIKTLIEQNRAGIAPVDTLADPDPAEVDGTETDQPGDDAGAEA